MRIVRYLLNRQPLLSAILTIVPVFFTAAMLRGPILALVHTRRTADYLAMLCTAIMLGLALSRIRAYKGVGVSTPMRQWQPGWWLPVLAMTPLVLPTFLMDQVNWGALEYSSRHAFDWFVKLSSTGAFEEILFRGAFFYILYRVWGSTRSGLQRAAVTQALLFGALHLINLTNRDLTYVLFQICIASLAGYAFAGLVAYTRSLWPAIVLHAGVNAMGSIDNYFAGPGYVFHADTILSLSTRVGAFFVFGALPGYWCLKRAPLSDEGIRNLSGKNEAIC
jgi:membrane protease YdiL (CAAX protease family)